jgi:hypothetical protein
VLKKNHTAKLEDVKTFLVLADGRRSKDSHLLMREDGSHQDGPHVRLINIMEAKG